MTTQTEKRSLRIFNLYAENVKKIKVVDITPDSDVVQITGRNGQGKTSVLDAILYALGGLDTIPASPVRRGEARAEIIIDIGEAVVRRTWGAKGPELHITSKDGTVIKQPQGYINGLMDKVSFDPLAFTRKKPVEQAEQLKKLVQLDIDPDELDKQNKADYDKRREITREKGSVQARLDAMPAEPAGVPKEAVEVSALTAALEEAGRHNTRIEAATAQKKQYSERSQRSKAEQKRIEEEIEGLELRIVRLKESHAEAEAEALELELKAAAIEIPHPVDTAKLRQDIDQAQRDNRWIEQRAIRAALQAEVEELDTQAVRYTEAMAERTEAKRQAIANAKMPVEGLSFEDGQVFYQGFPFEQASGAEQLRVSMAIAMAGNPKLRIVRIVDGSLLDDNSMELVKKLARERDFQVWIEMVDTSGEVGIVMTDGEVESTPRSRAKGAKKAAK